MPANCEALTLLLLFRLMLAVPGTLQKSQILLFLLKACEFITGQTECQCWNYLRFIFFSSLFPF